MGAAIIGLAGGIANVVGSLVSGAQQSRMQERQLAANQTANLAAVHAQNNTVLMVVVGAMALIAAFLIFNRNQ